MKHPIFGESLRGPWDDFREDIPPNPAILPKENVDWTRNFFDVILRDAKTGEIIDRAQTHNLVSYAGRSAFLKWIQHGHASQGGSLRYCAVGTSTATPAYGDTALGSEVVRKQYDSWDNSNIDSVPPNGPKMVMSTMFLAAEANGTIAEFGLFQNSSGTPMFNRALLAQGNITNITKADPGVVTSSGHGLTAGQKVKPESVGGMTEVNGNVYIVDAPTTDEYSLSGTNTTTYGTYTSGGKWTRVVVKTTDSVMTVLATVSNMPA